MGLLNMYYVAVDFDGTLVDHRFPEIGPPVPEAFKWMRAFQKMGAKIILNTMRSDHVMEDGTQKCPLSSAVDFIKNQGISLYGINENPDQKSWTSSPKVYANVYIDDAAVGCPLIKVKGFHRLCVDWTVVGMLVHKKIQEYNVLRLGDTSGKGRLVD